MPRAALNLSREDVRAAGRFLASLWEEGSEETQGMPVTTFSRDQYWSSYPQWAKGGHAWNAMEQGGTGIMHALMWYHHVHKPGSREWRPSIIIRAVVEHARTRCAPAAAPGTAPHLNRDQFAGLTDTGRD